MKEKFVPRDKMSKKARKAMDRKKREAWGFSPVSRVIPNKKKDFMKIIRKEDVPDDFFIEKMEKK